ncbi:hypothetical protein [Planctomyces sp. SH-PL62]|uniref:hypothetical protein n=1 Tax=Planctomyces sp. SH-PL62 TaxID=1636152 RepID=UPI00078D7318|nr:hypothetical protein [Planctomyces sp. SH-PL62]AMV38864.1 hypothetical protein VT85_15625 [Planctomyces sp. SH-PL62]
MDREPSEIGLAAAERHPPGRTLLTAAGVWAFGGAASAFFALAYSDPFIPLDWIARGLWMLAGVGLLAWCVRLARARQGRRSALAAGGLVVLTLALSPTLWPYLASVGGWAKIRMDFARNRSRYEKVVARLAGRPNPMPGRSEADGVSYIVGPGPPLRVAFPLPGGILDNWTAVVYDPSEEVHRMGRVGPDLSHWDDPDLLELRMWFGGTMRHARRLGGGFFYCIFT